MGVERVERIAQLMERFNRLMELLWSSSAHALRQFPHGYRIPSIPALWPLSAFSLGSPLLSIQPPSLPRRPSSLCYAYLYLEHYNYLLTKQPTAHSINRKNNACLYSTHQYDITYRHLFQISVHTNLPTYNTMFREVGT